MDKIRTKVTLAGQNFYVTGNGDEEYVKQLEQMGFTNVKYFAYEIDKYAKQVAMSNYPDIIQSGDAFDLRHPDWTIGY